MIRYIKFIVLSYASKSNTHQINEFNTQHLNKKNIWLKLHSNIWIKLNQNSIERISKLGRNTYL